MRHDAVAFIGITIEKDPQSTVGVVDSGDITYLPMVFCLPHQTVFILSNNRLRQKRSVIVCQTILFQLLPYRCHNPFERGLIKEIFRRTCTAILDAGIVALVCAGNEGNAFLQMVYPIPNNVRVPASCPPPYLDPDQMANPGPLSCVVAVGAVNYNDAAADFTSQGPVTWQDTEFGDYAYNPGIGLIRPDVCAPGVNIKSLDYNNTSGYTTMDGTSQATPCVAGIVTLMLQKNPELTPAQICQILEETSVKLTPNKSNITGVGRVDALAAVNAVPDWEGISENTLHADMFPNPTQDNFTIQCDSMRLIEVYSMDGRLVKSLSVHSSECLIEGLESGVYLVKIETNKGTFTKKIVKM